MFKKLCNLDKKLKLRLINSNTALCTDKTLLDIGYFQEETVKKVISTLHKVNKIIFSLLLQFFQMVSRLETS